MLAREDHLVHQLSGTGSDDRDGPSRCITRPSARERRANPSPPAAFGPPSRALRLEQKRCVRAGRAAAFLLLNCSSTTSRPRLVARGVRATTPRRRAGRAWFADLLHYLFRTDASLLVALFGVSVRAGCARCEPVRPRRLPAQRFARERWSASPAAAGLAVGIDRRCAHPHSTSRWAPRHRRPRCSPIRCTSRWPGPAARWHCWCCGRGLQPWRRLVVADDLEAHRLRARMVGAAAGGSGGGAARPGASARSAATERDEQVPVS